MYQTLFEVAYNHEYFAREPLDLRVELSPRTETLFNAMDMLINKSLGHMTVRWNDENTLRQELLNVLNDETLLFYFYPVKHEIFYAVSRGFLQQIVYQQHLQRNSDDTRKKVSRTFYLFQLENTSTLSLAGGCHPSDKLLYLESSEQLAQIASVDLSQRAKKIYADDEIKQLLSRVNRESAIVLSVPVAILRERLEQSGGHETMRITLNFDSISVRYKYYFMSIDDDPTLAVKSDTMSCVKGREKVGARNDTLTFVTESPIKLLRKPKENFRLIKVIDNKEESVIDDLPHPKPENIFMHTDSNNEQVKVIEAFIN